MVLPAHSDRSPSYEDDMYDDDTSPLGHDSHEQGYDEPDEDSSYDDDSSGGQASDDFQREVENSSSLSTEQLQKEIERYKDRLNGANRKVQELMQGRTALETQRQQERAQYLEALMRERIQDLPPDEQQERMQMFYTALEHERQQAQTQQERALYGEVARRATIMDIARKYAEYGVTEEDLEPFDSSREMLVVAEREKQRAQTQKRQRRRRRRTDNFESPEPASTPPKEPQTIEDAESAFKTLYRKARRRR